MSVANLELCKELYELSGWDTGNDGFHYHQNLVPDPDYQTVACHVDSVQEYAYIGKRLCPAYDLGYLLRKLPKFGKYTPGDGTISKFKTRVTVTVADSGTWVATMDSDNEDHGWIDPQYADTPEDAACKLAVELFKQGILVKEQS